MAGGHQLGVLRRQSEHDEILDLIPQPSDLPPAARHQQCVAKIESLILQLRRQPLTAMADRQNVEIVFRAEPDIAQGLTDQPCFRRQHNLSDADLLEGLVALPLIQSRQRDQVVSRDQLLRLFFVTDGEDGVIGLEHGLRQRRQELCSAMLMFLKADENSAKTVEQLRLRNRLTNQRRAARNLQTVPLIG